MTLVLSISASHRFAMPQDPHAKFDEAVLDMIDHSPVGAVPMTPAYQDGLTRLYAAHKIYASADHRNGHVTARSLALQPSFHASNLADLIAGTVNAEALESNVSIFDRYVKAVPESRRAQAEAFRLTVAGRPAHHRKHGANEAVHDPIHSLFLVPGTGPHPGLPGNYLYGSVLQLTAAADAPWAVHLHDGDDGVSLIDVPTMPDALAKLMEVMESAPFTMSELEAIGFRLV